MHSIGYREDSLATIEYIDLGARVRTEGDFFANSAFYFEQKLERGHEQARGQQLTVSYNLVMNVVTSGPQALLFAWAPRDRRQSAGNQE